MSMIQKPEIFITDPKRTVGKGNCYHEHCKGCYHPFAGEKYSVLCQICLGQSDVKSIPVWVVMDRLTYEIVKILYRRSRPFSWEAWAFYAGMSVDEAITAFIANPMITSLDQINNYDNVRMIP